MADRPAVADTLDWIRGRGFYTGQIEHRETVPGTGAEYGDLEASVPIALALQSQGIKDLYQHQVDAIQAVRNGENVVIATPTASGKSLVYQVAAAEATIENRGKTLYIAPLKALINDQADAFRSFSDALGMGESMSVGVQTGSTSSEERRRLKRTQPDVTLLNIDQVHLSLLPYGHSDTNWKWLFQQLEYVVIDEIHEYRGMFGSHASLVFRRLHRLADYYDADVQFICCSATIGNPVDHAANVTGAAADSFTLVNTDTSASGNREWVFWNPPLKEAGRVEKDEADETVPTSRGGANEQTTESESPGDEPQTDGGSTVPPSGGRNSIDTTPASEEDAIEGGERQSSRIEAARLAAALVARGYQTLAFTDARQEAQELAGFTGGLLERWGEADLGKKVHAYTGALRSGRRRDLETGLQNGSIRGAWTTNALELGIDIGSLDAVLLHGYPGTAMETFQRAGRAGRGEDDCLVVVVAKDNPLDQYVFNNPAELFDEGAEQATVNPQNDTVLPQHVRCAADEGYLYPRAEEYFGDCLEEVVEEAIAAGDIKQVGGGKDRWAAVTDNPAYGTNIRAIEDREITLYDTARDTAVGNLQFSDALRDVHPEARYVNDKTRYRVRDLDLDEGRAYLEEVNGDEYTQALQEKDIEVCEVDRSQTIRPGVVPLTVSFGSLRVTKQVTGYLEYDYFGDDSPTERTLDGLPAVELETKGLFFELPPGIEAEMIAQTDDSSEILHALHAIEHAFISLLPTEVLCDRRDVGGLSVYPHPATGGGAVFVHDGYEGGAGLTRAAFEQVGQLLDQVREVIACCTCDDGCPSCIHSPQCGDRNRGLNKELAVTLLRRLTLTR